MALQEKLGLARESFDKLAGLLGQARFSFLLRIPRRDIQSKVGGGRLLDQEPAKNVVPQVNDAEVCGACGQQGQVAHDIRPYR